jgi:hypothetical protein
MDQAGRWSSSALAHRKARMMDDGTNPFGDHTDHIGYVDFDTADWRAEMSERYGDGDTIDPETND